MGQGEKKLKPETLTLEQIQARLVRRRHLLKRVGEDIKDLSTRAWRIPDPAVTSQPAGAEKRDYAS